MGADTMRYTERIVMLQVIDNQWKDHLLSMDELKQGINLRAHGQKDPLVEYKKESYELFVAMMDRIEDEAVRFLYFLQVRTDSGPVLPVPGWARSRRNGGAEEAAPRRDPASSAAKPPRRTMQDFTRNVQRKKEKEMAELQFVGGEGSDAPKPVVAGKKVGRNESAPAAAARSTSTATERDRYP